MQDISDTYEMRYYNRVSTPTAFDLKVNKDRIEKKMNSTPCKKIVGGLMYLTTTRPNITYSNKFGK